MSRTVNHHELPVVSRHDLVVTLLEGPDHFNGHCTCDRWSYRTADWANLGMKWAWHYVAESEGPDGHPLTRRGAATAVEYDHGDNCERNCCWEDTVARRLDRDAGHQRVACRNCGNCLDCDDDASPDHEDCICPLGQALPVEVAA